MQDDQDKNEELSRYAKLIPYLALVACLLLTIVTWRIWDNFNTEMEKDRYTRNTLRIDRTIAARLHDYEMVLTGGAALFVASEGVNRNEWRAYAEYRKVQTLFPGIQGMGFARVIKPSKLAQHIRRVRSEGFPGYTVRPEGKRDVYTSIIFLEPFDARNQRAFGFDMFSEPVRRAAMERARDTGKISISGKVTLIQETGKDVQAGFLMYLPVYAKGMPLTGVEGRRAALMGYVYGPFRMNDLLEGVFPVRDNILAYQIYDGAEVSPAGIMFSSDATSNPAKEQRQPTFSSQKTVDLYGHQWTFHYHTGKPFDASADRYTSKVILGTGFFIAMLVFLFFRALLNTRERSLLLANEMTIALRKSEEKYRILNDSLSVGVSIIGPDMEILAANATKKRWFPDNNYEQQPLCYATYNDPPRTAPCEGCPVVKTFQDGLEHTAKRDANTLRGVRSLAITAVPVTDSDGKVISVHETVDDITEHKKLSDSLRESQELFRKTLDLGVVGMATTHPDTYYFLSANQHLCNMIGYTEEELLQKTWVEITFPKEKVDEDSVNLSKLLSGEWNGYVMEKQYQHKDGHMIDITLSVQGVRKKDGSMDYILILIDDITERKRAENDIQRLNERILIATRSAQVGIWDWDVTNNLLVWDDQMYALYGLIKDEFSGAYEAWVKGLHPDDRAAGEAILKQALQSEKYYESEFRVIWPDGSIHFLAATGDIIRDADGKALRMIGVNYDITDRKMAEKELAQYREHLEEIVAERTKELRQMTERMTLAARAGGVGVWDYDTVNNILVWDDQMFALYGITRDKFTGAYEAWQAGLHPEDRQRGDEEIRLALSGEKEFDTEFRVIWQDSTIRYIRALAIVQRDTAGHPLHMFGTNWDITETKNVHEQLDLSKKAAEAANRAKSTFVANMSHEIRTPMNAIMGFAQVLERDPSLTPQQTERVRIISRSGGHLLHLINDILDMSKIEAGRITINEAVFCLHDFLDDLELMFRSRTDAKGLQLLVERDESVPRYVTADEGKLRQVLVNLMGNAVKFTEKGGVAVRVRAEAATGKTVENKEALRLVFEVEDSGQGIPAEDMGMIFDAFQQAATGVKAGGTGLGLAISSRFVEMMGGKLTVTSQIGKGSCFRLEVLLKSAEAIAKLEKPVSRRVVGLEPGTGPFRILVVDDNADNRSLILQLLRPIGFEVAEAINGVEALEVFEDWSPHAVIMDMRMPVMDGYEATRGIKATAAGSTIPVIAVTASAFEDSRSQVMATGVYAYLRKPFQPDDLFELLGKSLDLHYVLAAEATAAPEHLKTVPLTVESLAALPGDMVEAMRLAVVGGNMPRLMELIAKVEKVDSATARGLQALADQYDYEKLSKWLRKEGIEFPPL